MWNAIFHPRALRSAGLRQTLGPGRRRELIDPACGCLSIARQCRFLGLPRSTFYYAPRGESSFNLELMRWIDGYFLECPFYGSRQMTRQLQRDGYKVSRKRVRRLMRLMGLNAIYRKPRTSDPHPAHRIYPYLLRGLSITRANQVWCVDITYIPMHKGFLYLVSIMDWYSRHVLSWPAVQHDGCLFLPCRAK